MICRSFLRASRVCRVARHFDTTGADSEPGGDYDDYAKHRFRASISDTLCDLGAQEI